MQYRQGYIALITVLIVSGVALAIAATVSLLGIGVAQSALSGSKGENALELTEGCAEDALLNSQQNSNYSGGNINRPEGTCVIRVSKNSNNWTIIATSTQTDYNRTVQINFVRTTNNPITISSWQESLPVTLDTNTSDTSIATSWNHTTSASLPNSIIIVGVNSTTIPSGVTYAAQALAEITGTCFNNFCSSLWYRISPIAGSNAVVVSGAGTILGGGSSTYYHVNQTTPIGNSNFASGGGSSLSVTVNGTNSTQLVVDSAGTPASSVSLTVGSGQAITWSTNQSGNAPMRGSSKIAGSSTNMSWSCSPVASCTSVWAAAAAALNQGP